MLMFHLTITTWSTAATLFSFIKLYKVKQLYKKREHIKGKIQYIQ